MYMHGYMHDMHMHTLHTNTYRLNGGLIPGFVEGLVGMKEGGKRCACYACLP